MINTSTPLITIEYSKKDMTYNELLLCVSVLQLELHKKFVVLERAKSRLNPDIKRREPGAFADPSAGIF